MCFHSLYFLVNSNMHKRRMNHIISTSIPAYHVKRCVFVMQASTHTVSDAGRKRWQWSYRACQSGQTNTHKQWRAQGERDKRRGETPRVCSHWYSCHRQSYVHTWILVRVCVCVCVITYNLKIPSSSGLTAVTREQRNTSKLKSPLFSLSQNFHVSSKCLK